jgi:hypothetical protein
VDLGPKGDQGGRVRCAEGAGLPLCGQCELGGRPWLGWHGWLDEDWERGACPIRRAGRG